MQFLWFSVIISNVSEIIAIRLRSFRFTLDLLSALPLDEIGYVIQISSNSLILTFLGSIRLVKIHRVSSFNLLACAFIYKIKLVGHL